MENKNFEKIRLVNQAKGSSVEGELVLETALSWQVAVGGKVTIFNKSEWFKTSGSFEDLFGGVFDGPNIRGNDGFGKIFGEKG